jgi:non-ribosomal peptide synthetase component F/acyl carrier protein
MKQVSLIYDRSMREASKYWRQRLPSMSFEAHVPIDHPRLKEVEPELAELEFALDENLHALLIRLASGNRFLSYTVLMLGLRVCCYKYSGSPDVTIFSPATSQAAVANALPIGGTLQRESSFRDALLATKDLLSEAFTNQQYAFSRMLLDLPNESRPKQLPMIAAMVDFNERLPEVRSDMAILFKADEARTAASFRFDRRLYDERTIRHLFDAYIAILRQGVVDTARRVADLSPICLETRGGPSNAAMRGLASSTNADCEDLREARVHRRIEMHAKIYPTRAAVVEGDFITSYGRLDSNAEQLAETLSQLKLNVRRPIGILTNRGTEAAISMLAVLKIGAAFAPVKLALITRPLLEVLGALGCECIICGRENLADLEESGHLVGVPHRITLERLTAGPGGCDSCLSIGYSWEASTTNRRGGAQPATGANDIDDIGPPDLACVLVEGCGNGLQISKLNHAELLHVFEWLNRACGIGTNDRCFLLPGVSACEQLYDMIGMLVAGASVEIARVSSLEPSALLAEGMSAAEVTVWMLPAPLMQNLLPGLVAMHAQDPSGCGPRNILLTGEKQCAGLAAKLSKCFPAARIMGLYASPAVGLWSLFFPFGDGNPGSHWLPVAHSIPGFEHPVLNKAGDPTPLSAKGKLYVRHLTDPLRLRAVDTGLRAEPLGDGQVRWLRGSDHCFVKHECSVELTELEAILCRHEDIRAAEVIGVATDDHGGNRVLAFVSGLPERLTAEDARDFLLSNGEVDLSPDRFIVLQEFPLTSDGAIDRDALVSSHFTSKELKDDARDEVTKEIYSRLKAIWINALQVDQVDDDDSFFAQGGNSLKATLLIARIKDEIAVDLSVQDFFRKPTLSAVTQLIRAASKSSPPRQRIPDFKPVSRDTYRVELSEL